MNKRHVEDNQAGKEPEGKEPEEKEEKKNFLSEIGRFFDSVAEILTNLGSGAPQAAAPIQETHKIQPLKMRTNLVQGAQSCREHLMRLREELLAEFGTNCTQFILKSIDPMIRHIEEIVLHLEHAETTPSLEEEAIRSVSLYSEFKDERKLRRKIINEAVYSCREAIEKDCQILRNYQHHAELANQTLDESKKAALETSLEPILHEFHELHLTRFGSEDIRDFFIWKSRIDERRAKLCERGFQTIDSHLGAMNPKGAHEEAAEELLIEQDDDTLHEPDYFS